MRHLAAGVLQHLVQGAEAVAARAVARTSAAALQAAQLSTGAPAESQWQLVLKQAAAAYSSSGGGGAAVDSCLQVAAPMPTPAAQLRQQHAAAAAQADSAAEPAAPRIPALPGAAADRELPLQMDAATLQAIKSRQAARAMRSGSPAWQVEASDSDGGSGGGSGGGTGSKGKAGRRRARRKLQQQRGAAAAAAEVQAEADAEADSSGSSGEEGLLNEPGTGAHAAAAEPAAAPADAAPQLASPTVLQDDAHPIRDEDIARPAWHVLSRLRAAGHEAYVVGGTIRDLLLGGTPKDYDLLTSAELHQMKRLFSRCMIVGRSFPVCHVHAEGTIIEVTSFSTNANQDLIPSDASVHMIGRQKLKRPRRVGATWAAARADNAVRRDFTVNGLLYDPFSRLLFDAVGGVADCGERLLRTIAPPRESFEADPARILRGVRLAARAGLELDEETAAAIEEQATAVGQLPQGRLQMEINSLLGYGASQRSLALMWRLGLLDLLLPQHALYLKRRRLPRAPLRPRGGRTAKQAKQELLFEVAAELDRHVHPQRPVDPAVWLALLAAPLVAERCAKLAGKRRRGRRGKAGPEPPADGEAMSGGEASQEGSADGRGAAGGLEGSESGSGSEGEGLGGAAVRSVAGAHGQRSLGEPGGEQAARAARERYLERYAAVVAEVLEGMQKPLDAATLKALGGEASKRGELLASGGSRGRAKRRQGEGGGPAVALLPCVLSKAAVERAAALLLLEAEQRSQPALGLPLGEGGLPVDAAAAPWDAGAAGMAEQASASDGDPLLDGGEGGPGPHHAWQRLERALGGGGSGPQTKPVTTAAPAALEVLQRRRRPGRRLSAEERLVLGILGEPRLDFAARTALP